MPADPGHGRQEPEPGAGAGLAQGVEERALRRVEGEGRHIVALGTGGQGVDALAVGGGVDPYQLGDGVVAERLGVAQQGHGGGEALEVPEERADVGLVEVVDVEDQAAVGVHVGAEVLGVEVAVDPHPAGAVVQVRSGVPPVGQVVVEEAGRAPVEGEGGGGHLPELDAEGGRVGCQQLSERGVEDGEDLLAAPAGPVVLERHRWSSWGFIMRTRVRSPFHA
nr:hypothetical protein [Streptomyces sp. I05A-00742]